MTLVEVAQSAGITHEEFIKQATLAFLNAAISSTNKKGVLKIHDIVGADGAEYTLLLKRKK